MEESSSEEASGTEAGSKMGFSYSGVSRAVVEDDTALLLADVGSFRKEAMRLLRKGSDASRILHLYYKHDAVQCARLHEGGYGIMVSPVDARDQFTWTPLQVAADLHSARRIELLLSKNARTDLVDGRPLLALGIALMNRRVHVEWSPNNSIEDPLAYLLEMDLKEVAEVADRYAMQGRVTALAMLLLVVEAKISAPVSVVIDGIRTKRSIYNSVVDEVLSNGDALARDGNERRKALLCEIQLLNQFGALSWRDYQMYNISLPPLLRAAKVGDMKAIKMPLMGDVDVNEADPEGNMALRWCLNGTASTHEPSIAWLLLKNGARVFQGNKLGLKPVHSAAAKGNYEDLQSILSHAQDCIDMPSNTKETSLFFEVKSGSVNCAKILLCFGANPKAQNLQKQRPIDMATSQDTRFILNSANVVPWNHVSLHESHVMRKESHNKLLDGDFYDYDSDGSNESYTMLATSAGHQDFWPSSSAQMAKSTSQSAPKQGPKFPQHNNHWEKHDYTCKIFAWALPSSEDNAFLRAFFTAESGHVDEIIVIGIKTCNRMLCCDFDFVQLQTDTNIMRVKEARHVYVPGKRAEIKDCRVLGYPKLSDFMRSLPGICRMSVVPVGNGPATPLLSQPKSASLLQPFCFDHEELPESVSDHQSPRSPLTTSITEDASHITNNQHGDAYNDSNLQGLQGDKCGRSNAEIMQDGDSTSNGSLLDEITVSTTKLDLVELPTRKPHLVEFPPTRKLDLVEPGTKKFDLIESRALRKLDRFKPGPTRKLDFIGSKPLACLDSVESESIQSGSIQIFIKSWRQGPSSFQVSLDEPFHSVMKMVKDKTSFHHPDDYISYMNKVVCPDLALRLYGIEKDCTININARMRGGQSTFTEFVAENKKNFTTLVILPDGNLSLKISTFGCQFLSSLVSCFIFTFSKQKSWDGQYAWNTHFKIRNNSARIAKQANGGLTSSSMENDISPLVEFIRDTFSSNDMRLQNKFPPYLESFMSHLKGMKLPVLTPVDKLVLETAVCYMEPYDRMTLTIMLKRKHEGLSDDPDRKKWNEVIATLPEVDWPSKLGKLIMIEDVIESARQLRQEYSMSGFCSFRLERDICIHGLRQRNKPHPNGKPGDKKIEMFQDNDGVELMIPSRMGDILHDLVVRLIKAGVDIKRELTHALVRSKEPSSPVVSVSDSVRDDYIPTWMLNRRPRVTEAGASSSSQSKPKYQGILSTGGVASSRPSTMPKGQAILSTGAVASSSSSSEPKGWSSVVSRYRGGHQ